MRRKAIEWVEEREHRRILRWPGVLLGCVTALAWVAAVWGGLSLVALVLEGARP